MKSIGLETEYPSGAKFGVLALAKFHLPQGCLPVVLSPRQCAAASPPARGACLKPPHPVSFKSLASLPALPCGPRVVGLRVLKAEWLQALRFEFPLGQNALGQCSSPAPPPSNLPTAIPSLPSQLFLKEELSCSCLWSDIHFHAVRGNLLLWVTEKLI